MRRLQPCTYAAARSKCDRLDAILDEILTEPEYLNDNPDSGCIVVGGSWAILQTECPKTFRYLQMTMRRGAK